VAKKGKINIHREGAKFAKFFWVGAGSRTRARFGTKPK
jgi:hypothetical protein